jgi:DNA-binding NtrC family response regulator
VLKILLVDDEPDLLLSLAQLLRADGHQVETAPDGEAALGKLATQHFHLVLTDVRLPKVDGMTLLRRVHRDFPATEVMLMTAFGSIGDAVSAMKDHAVDYLTKPFDVDRLIALVERVEEKKRIADALESAHSQRDTGEPHLRGRSPAIQELLDRIATIADTSAAVLVTGESGTGKEVVARILHERSRRRERPLVFVNCAAVPPSLIEAELFGHERGAFTGAIKKREGRFQVADGGTLVLDEIGELPLETQAKLLRVLQDGDVVPVGSNVAVKVDVRIISATNRDLKAMVEAGRFREDLYYRVKVFEVHVPPLRDRRSDLPILIEHFLREFAVDAAALPTLSPAAWTALQTYAFPGNVRELRHAMQHACILARGGEIDVGHLPREIAGDAVGAFGSAKPSSEVPRASLSEAMEQYEKELILRTVHAAGEKRQRAAKLLGISRKSLWKKLTKYGAQAHRRNG